MLVRFDNWGIRALPLGLRGDAVHILQGGLEPAQRVVGVRGLATQRIGGELQSEDRI